MNIVRGYVPQSWFEHGKRTFQNLLTRINSKSLVGPLALQAMKSLEKSKREQLSVIDPYHDFEHQPGEGYNVDDLRPWFVRIFTKSDKPVVIRLRLEFERNNGVDDEPYPLDPQKYVYIYKGDSVDNLNSYTKLPSDILLISSPYQSLALDLSKLQPGRYSLIAEAQTAEQSGRIAYFYIFRFPFYTFHDTKIGQDIKTRSPLHVSLNKDPEWIIDLGDQFVWMFVKIPDVLSWLETLILKGGLILTAEGLAGKSKAFAEIAMEKLLKDYGVKLKPDGFHWPAKDLDAVKAFLKQSKLVTKSFEERSHEGFDWWQYIAGHSWKVFRNAWPDSWPSPDNPNYTQTRALDIHAITLMARDRSPVRTRWIITPEPVLDPKKKWERFEFTSWRNPEEHEMFPDPVEWGLYDSLSSHYRADNSLFNERGGFGLPFPILEGLPKQPLASGSYEKD